MPPVLRTSSARTVRTGAAATAGTSAAWTVRAGLFRGSLFYSSFLRSFLYRFLFCSHILHLPNAGALTRTSAARTVWPSQHLNLLQQSPHDIGDIGEIIPFVKSPDLLVGLFQFL
jgi:hypothetical protein